MTLPTISTLSISNWQILGDEGVDGRLLELQRMENALAEQEHRESYKIKIFEGPYDPYVRGECDNKAKEISLNPDIVYDDKPYQAVETYFHEARHAYQYAAIQHPEIHDNAEEVEDWKKNQTAYIDKEDIELGNYNFSHYRWQPVEADANKTARERTNELYSGMLQDNEQYPDYKAEKENELSGHIERAKKIELGENYQEEAREAMISKYQNKLEQQDNLSEDYDYGYGY